MMLYFPSLWHGDISHTMAQKIAPANSTNKNTDEPFAVRGKEKRSSNIKLWSLNFLLKINIDGI